jgi:hypothetical protein
MRPPAPGRCRATLAPPESCTHEDGKDNKQQKLTALYVPGVPGCPLAAWIFEMTSSTTPACACRRMFVQGS